MLFSLQLCVHGVLVLCLYMCVRKEKVQEKFILSWGFHIHCGSGCQEQRIHQFSLPIHRRQKKRNRQTKLQISNATQDHKTTDASQPHEWACVHCSFPQSVVRAQTPNTKDQNLLFGWQKVTHQSFKHTNRKLSKQTHHQWLAREIACFKWKFSGTHLHQDKAKERKAWDGDAAATKTGWYQQQQQQPNPQKQTTLNIQKARNKWKAIYTQKIIIPTPQQNQQCKRIQCKNYPRRNFDIENLSSFCSLKNLLCFLEIY